jgi:hypothetical protein
LPAVGRACLDEAIAMVANRRAWALLGGLHLFALHHIFQGAVVISALVIYLTYKNCRWSRWHQVARTYNIWHTPIYIYIILQHDFKIC